MPETIGQNIESEESAIEKPSLRELAKMPGKQFLEYFNGLKVRERDDLLGHILIDYYKEIVLILAANRGIKPEYAEDIFQEIAIGSAKTIGKFRGNSSFDTWISSIIKKRIADYCRKDIRRKELDASNQEDLKHTYKKYVDEDPLSKEEVYTEEIIKMAPKNCREILRLMNEGYDFVEIAGKLNLSYDAVRDRIKRLRLPPKDKPNKAIQKFRTELEQGGYEV